MTHASDSPPADVLAYTQKVFPDSGAFGWRDISAHIMIRGVGENDPNWAQIGGGPLMAYKFIPNDRCWFMYHIPHDVVPAAEVFFHVHWLADGVDENPVRWEWTYSYAKGFNQAAFDPAGATVIQQESSPGVPFQHMTSETEGVLLPALTEPDGIIQARIRRVANGGVENADDVFMLTADVHYQSTDRATFNKLPEYYA